MKRRPTAYDRDQHELICDHLDTLNYSDPAFEAVVRMESENCRLRERLEVLEGAITGCVLVIQEGRYHLSQDESTGEFNPAP